MADANVERAERRAIARREHAQLLATAEADVTAGRATFGETLVRLGFLERAMEDGVDPSERDRALALYRSLLAEVRASVAGGATVQRAVLDAVEADGRVARYKRMYPRLFDALVHGGGNCVALSSLAIALAYDAGAGGQTSLRVFSNHAAPDVDGFRFGMSARCHGPGVVLDARSLLRSSPFVSPKSQDACDDPGDVYGGLQLEEIDPPPIAAKTAPNAPEAECRRRTVMEEYDGDVEVVGDDGRSLGGVGVAHAATLDLEGRAASAACFERKLEALDAAADPETLALTLGDLALAEEEAARVFALAGETDVAREYDRRLASHRERASVPLETLLARLADPTADTTTLVQNAGRLVALGASGRRVMQLASERHAGFWELANLMTRPASSADAIARWRAKPIDVKLDVVDALPCSSQSFLAQQTDRDLLAACEARVRGETAACGSSLHADGDLAEAVLVRRLSARCKSDDAFVGAARTWAISKPAPLALAATRRLP